MPIASRTGWRVTPAPRLVRESPAATIRQSGVPVIPDRPAIPAIVGIAAAALPRRRPVAAMATASPSGLATETETALVLGLVTATTAITAMATTATAAATASEGRAAH